MVVVDAQNPLGNGRLLPRGPLREGPSALERLSPRGLLWLTRVDAADPTDPQLVALRERARASSLAGPVESHLVPADDGSLRDRKVFLLTGIARPSRVHDTLRVLGAALVGERAFADHHAFTAAELAEVDGAARALGAASIVTTEKDLVRLPPSPPGALPIVAAAVGVRLRAGLGALDEALDRALAEGSARSAAARPDPRPGEGASRGTS